MHSAWLAFWLCSQVALLDVTASQAFRGAIAKHKILKRMEADYRCRGFRNKDACRRIMSHAVLKESHQLAKITAPMDFITQRPKCPKFDFQYLEKMNLPAGLRSLSPFDKAITYDPHRKPRYIFQARCLCRGCISPRTLTETRSYMSVPTKVHVPVLKRRDSGRWFQTTEKIALGCVCVVPTRTP